jgi:hypothetical protein
MHAWGWVLVFCGIFSVIAFVIGVFTGETAFLLPAKSGGTPATASLAESPAVFYLLMVLNAVLSVAIWALFFSWLRRRRG